jgi:Zn-dependent peptidase ImmA (M78 family)
MYDPHAHATTMNIPIIYSNMTALAGLWLPAAKVILLKTGMHKIHERSVLAHELAHAELGHTFERQEDLHQTNEHAANAHAAKNLVDPRRYFCALQQSNNHADWARACNVTLEIVEHFNCEDPEFAHKYVEKNYPRRQNS